MGDIKLFKIEKNKVIEVGTSKFSLEKEVQTLIEKNLDSLLNVKLIKSEHPTGKKHKGRIDTLGIDENNCPVIIEYKRHTNENVINQGLFYLDWLMDHKAEFEKLALPILEDKHEVDWTSPRLLCIAGDFTKYDAYAIEQIDRNIELIRFRRYEDGFLLFELVNATGLEIPISKKRSGKSKLIGHKHRINVADKKTIVLFEMLESFILSLGDDVQKKQLKHYIAYRRLRNFACVEVHKRHILVYIKLDPKNVASSVSIARDVSNIGHYGTGNLELRIESKADFEKAEAGIEMSYYYS